MNTRLVLRDMAIMTIVLGMSELVGYWLWAIGYFRHSSAIPLPLFWMIGGFLIGFCAVVLVGSLGGALWLFGLPAIVHRYRRRLVRSAR